MKKRIIGICVLCLAAVFMFAACSTPTDTTSTEATTEPTTEATAEPTTEATTETTPEAPAEAEVDVNEGAATPVEVNGTWTDPLTGNTLEMTDGSFTLADADGNTLSDGTYEAGEVDNTYTVTAADGTTGTFTVTDTAIEFTNSDGTVVVYETQTVE